MEAWSPFDSSKFTRAYVDGASDMELAQAFNSTPDKVKKYLGRKFETGDLMPRRVLRSGAVDIASLIKLAAEEEAVLPDNLPSPYTKGSLDNVLIIGDTHLPFVKPGYLEFCREVQEQFHCGIVVHVGDEVDNCAMSYHEADPDGHAGGKEADLAQAELNKWYHVFPNVNVVIGNHTALHFRKAFTSGIPKRFLKNYAEVWNAPNGWQWALDYEIHGVYYTHGTGSAGDSAAYRKSMNRRQSVVQGHVHTSAGVMFNAGREDNIWGMQVGCGICDEAYAMAYARDNARKSVISCGVVLDKGKIPIVVTM